jgi:hypothetical protein
MVGPTFGTIILKKYILNESINLKNQFFNFSFKKYILTLGLFLALILIFLFYILIFGNLLGFKELGRLNFSLDFIIRSMDLSHIKNIQGDKFAYLLPYIIFSSALFFISIFSGFINSLFASFEEIGWRGFLYDEFSNIGYFKKNLFTGVLWGIWHIPIVLQGLNFSQSPILGSIIIIFACISLSFVLNFIKQKTNSIFLVSVFHGMINGVGGFIISFIENPNDLFCGLVGIYGILATATLALFIHLFTSSIKKLKTFNTNSISY